MAFINKAIARVILMVKPPPVVSPPSASCRVLEKYNPVDDCTDKRKPFFYMAGNKSSVYNTHDFSDDHINLLLSDPSFTMLYDLRETMEAQGRWRSGFDEWVSSKQGSE